MTEDRRSPTYQSLPPIPAIPEELIEPIQCLAQAARAYRAATRAALAKYGTPLDDKSLDVLNGFDAIIDVWLDHPDLDIELDGIED
jgi:hypothetical protein